MQTEWSGKPGYSMGVRAVNQYHPRDEEAPKMSDLTETQLTASQLEGPAVVLAGAGTGKTRTLVAGILDRIQRRQIDPGNILAVTFTNKAAQEMKQRLLQQLDPSLIPKWVGTFHSHGYAQIRRFPEIASLAPGVTIADDRKAKKILKKLLNDRKDVSSFPDLLDRYQGETNISEKTSLFVFKRICEFKENLIEPDEVSYFVERQLDSGYDDLGYYGKKNSFYNRFWLAAAAIYPVYQAALRAENLADFSDLLLWPTLAMTRDERFRRYWAKVFQYVLVDEFQDVNFIQYSWLKLIARDHNEIFAVGDDAQEIYGFRGAKVRYIREFKQNFPKATVISLEENFRSTGNILTAANAIIQPDGVKKTLFTKAVAGEKICLVPFADADKEAEGVAKKILDLHHSQGENFNDFAILYRNNNLSRQFEEALRKAHIPYELVKDFSFWRREVVKDSIALLECYLYPDDVRSNESFCRIVNKPARAVGPKKIEKFQALAEEKSLTLFQAAELFSSRTKAKSNKKLTLFLDLVRNYKPKNPAAHISFRLSELLNLTGYQDMCRTKRKEGDDDLANIDELIEVLKDYDEVEDFFQHARLDCLPEAGQKVKLMTIHASKGMEFRNVFLIGWEAQIIPSPHSEIANEDRRLAYVAITRAEKFLAITWSQFRNNKSADASRFIGELPSEVVERQSWN